MHAFLEIALGSIGLSLAYQMRSSLAAATVGYLVGMLQRIFHQLNS